jgi:maleylacetate reductase
MSQLNSLPQELVVWGKSILSETVASLGDRGFDRPIIFTVPPLETMNGEYVQAKLKNRVGVFTDLPAHAPDVGIRSGLKACVEAGAHCIVAHGGGSVLDAAKAVSYLHHQQTGRYLPIAALPTTLSGSEFSHYFGITETGGPQTFKRSYAVRETVPRLVVLDPILLLDTPRELLLSSAFKGIDHAVEGMRKVPSDHPHAIMAASGVERFFAVMSRWPKEGTTRELLAHGAIDMNDLVQFQLAAWHCYFSPASVIYGLSHRIGHILGGTFGVPHSLTSCVTLAPVIRACREFYRNRLDVFAVKAASGDAALHLADRIEAAVREFGLPDRLRQFNLAREQFATLADLLESNYPDEVADLGAESETNLDKLLESLW